VGCVIDAKLIFADPEPMRPAFHFLRIGNMNLAAIGGFFSGQGIHVTIHYQNDLVDRSRAGRLSKRKFPIYV
jgi:hypothetical protein